MLAIVITIFACLRRADGKSAQRFIQYRRFKTDASAPKSMPYPVAMFKFVAQFHDYDQPRFRAQPGPHYAGDVAAGRAGNADGRFQWLSPHEAPGLKESRFLQSAGEFGFFLAASTREYHSPGHTKSGGRSREITDVTHRIVFALSPTTAHRQRAIFSRPRISLMIFFLLDCLIVRCHFYTYWRIGLDGWRGGQPDAQLLFRAFGFGRPMLSAL